MKVTQRDVRVFLLGTLAFFIFESIYNWKENKSDFLKGWNDASNNRQIKPIKMKEAKKLFTGVLLTMVALFIIESIYNWKESKAAFMKAYDEGRNPASTIVIK